MVEKCFVIYGQPDSGKTTIANMLAKCFENMPNAVRCSRLPPTDDNQRNSAFCYELILKSGAKKRVGITSLADQTSRVHNMVSRLVVKFECDIVILVAREEGALRTRTEAIFKEIVNIDMAEWVVTTLETTKRQKLWGDEKRTKYQKEIVNNILSALGSLGVDTTAKI